MAARQQTAPMGAHGQAPYDDAFAAFGGAPAPAPAADAGGFGDFGGFGDAPAPANLLPYLVQGSVWEANTSACERSAK